MYNQGLQNKELQLLHKKLGLNLNLFLPDILNNTNLFKIIEKNNKYHIYPLFYCDRIETDGDGVFINGTYLLIVPKDYKQIFLFITDNNVEFEPFFTLRVTERDNVFLLFVYDLVTLQPLRNRKLTVREYDKETAYYTDKYGYCFISVIDYDFEVVF